MEGLGGCRGDSQEREHEQAFAQLINKKRLSIIDSLSSFLKNEICYYADYDDCAYHH